MLIKKNHTPMKNTKNEKHLFSFLNRIPVPKRFSTLRFKLILSFLIPIAFIILLGVASYQMSATGLANKYRDTATQVINKTAEYIDFGLETVENTSLEYLNDKNIISYITYSYKDNAADMIQVKKTIQNDFVVKSMVDKFIGDIYIIPDNGVTISSISTLKQDGVYKEIIENDFGKQLTKTNFIWSGVKPFMDEILGTDNSDYALRLSRKFPSHPAILVIDVNADTIKQTIEDTNLDETGILAFVTHDGKEISKNNIDEISFSNYEFYKKAVEKEDPQGSEYVNINGKSYLFMYSKIGESGAMICAMIPEATITSQADNIKQITIFIVIIACIIAVSIGVFISTGIDKTIKGIISGLKNAAKGDLTVEFHTNRNDEFKTLIAEIQHTFSNMKDLIKQVNVLSGDVSESSVELNHTSSVFLKSTEDISHAINEIEQGLMQQAKDAEECLMQMDNLSKKIVLVSDNTKEIGQIADNAKTAIIAGTQCTQELNAQTKSTIEITTDIVNAIENLAEKSKIITEIINVINEIANRTNLLSLNAAIEAARAGEHGKSFAVVANEIRNLAEKSKQSVNEVHQIISSIWSDTKYAVETAKKVEDVLGLQENAVKNTTLSYDKINESVEKLMVYLNYISENVENIEESRVTTLSAIENISAVMEEVAASSNTVGQSAAEQLKSVEDLNKSAGTLKDNAAELTLAVQKFTV